MRMLRLSGLDSDAMTDDQRDAFVNMAENLGIEPVKPRTWSIFISRKPKNARNPAPSQPVVSKGRVSVAGQGAGGRASGSDSENRHQRREQNGRVSPISKIRLAT